MTYDDLMNLVLSSKGEDWLRSDEKGIFTLKTNLEVTLREVRTEIGDRKRFPEEWAVKFPDPVAYPEVFELWFGNSYVKSYHFVSVDGGRASLPYPKSADDLTITREELAIADAVNTGGFRSYFEDYIQRFNLVG